MFRPLVPVSDAPRLQIIGDFNENHDAKGMFSSAASMSAVPGAINLRNTRPADMPVTGETLDKAAEQRNYKLTTIQINKLTPTQKVLNQETVDKYKQTLGENEHPRIVQFEGKNYIYDGHHRIAAVAQSGGKSMTVELYKASSNHKIS